jgi:hypothetical protein
LTITATDYTITALGNTTNDNDTVNLTIGAAGVNFDLGTAAVGGGGEISETEFQAIGAANLTLTALGDVSIGGLTQTNTQTQSGTTLISAAAGDIETTADIRFAKALQLKADHGIDLEHNLVVDSGNILLDGDLGDDNDGGEDNAVQVTAAKDITATAGSVQIEATTGNITFLGATTIEATTGITLTHNVTATAGNLTLSGDTNAAAADTGTVTVAAAAALVSPLRVRFPAVAVTL